MVLYLSKMWNNHLTGQLVQKNIVKYGNFTLKSGKQSNIYVNLKNLSSHPKLMSGLCVQMKKHIKLHPKNKFAYCGVPLGGVPLATTMSLLTGKPQLLLRNEAKSYGMKKRIEGDTSTKNIILIEDVVTTGSSILESCKILEEEGFNIQQVCCFVYRGEDEIPSSLDPYNFSYLYHINDLQRKSIQKPSNKQQDLINHIQKKGSKLILAYDKAHQNAKKDLVELLDKIHPYIAGVKIHNEILGLSYKENLELYKRCKEEWGIFLWEDRKFNDIGNTIQQQLSYYENIRDYISIVPTSGSDALNIKTDLGLFILCEMSCRGNLFSPLVSASILSMLDSSLANICGIICQDEELFQLPIPTIMPGVHLKSIGDDLGQQWRNPQELEHKPLMYVVGRAITNADNPVAEIKNYNASI